MKKTIMMIASIITGVVKNANNGNKKEIGFNKAGQTNQQESKTTVNKKSTLNMWAGPHSMFYKMA